MSSESSQCASAAPSNRRANTDRERHCDGEEDVKRAKLEPSPASNARRPRGPRGDRANESGSESDDEDTSGLLLKAQKPHATAAGAAPNASSQSSDASAAPKVVRAPMQGRVDLPRKVALLFMYYGVGYYGLQRNPNSPYRAVEDELLDALAAVNAISEEDVADPARRLQFQRCARTDKSVSALGQCCSLRLRIVPFGTGESASAPAAAATATSTQSQTEGSGGGGAQASATTSSPLTQSQGDTAADASIASASPSASASAAAPEPAASIANTDNSTPNDTSNGSAPAPQSDAPQAVGKGGRRDPNAADCARLVDRINEQLPDQIRVIDVLRVRNSFDAKNECDFRTYLYLLPTFALAPVEQFITNEFTISQSQLDLFRKFLERYRGTHRFHNFTSGMKYEQPQSRRFMMELTVCYALRVVEEPRVVRALMASGPTAAAGSGRDRLECVLVRVRGQSFMLNQIRKMLGFAVAVVRGIAPDSVLDMAFGPAKVELPRIPGLGLMLDRVHYQYYNRRYGADGLHVAIDWERYEESMQRFRDEYIWPRIVHTELEQRPIWNWLQELTKFTYAERVQITAMTTKNLSNQEAAINSAPDLKACPPTAHIDLPSEEASNNAPSTV